MYKNVFQTIDNIAIWPIISLSIFFIFFILLLWWVFSADKTYINEVKNMPLDDRNTEPNSSVTPTTSTL